MTAKRPGILVTRARKSRLGTTEHTPVRSPAPVNDPAALRVPWGLPCAWCGRDARGRNAEHEPVCLAGHGCAAERP